jgi:hypothetical protein
MNETILATNFDQAAKAKPGLLTQTTTRSRKTLWAGRALSSLAVLFLTFDAGVKLLALPFAVDATTQLGFPASTLFGIGLIELFCLAAYLIPRTALIGAILWTGYLGGAISAKVRLGSPLFSDTLFPIYIAALLWGGLYLRDRRVRTLLALGAKTEGKACQGETK